MRTGDFGFWSQLLWTLLTDPFLVRTFDPFSLLHSKMLVTKRHHTPFLCRAQEFVGDSITAKIVCNLAKVIALMKKWGIERNFSSDFSLPQSKEWLFLYGPIWVHILLGSSWSMNNRPILTYTHGRSIFADCHYGIFYALLFLQQPHTHTQPTLSHSALIRYLAHCKKKIVVFHGFLSEYSC